MSTITPPQPPQPPTVTPSPAPVVVVPRPPVELARLALGSLLEASVLNSAGKDTFVLQTPIGQLSVQTAVALPKDAALILQVLSLSPVAQLQINTINGKTPAAALRAVPTAGQLPGTENLLRPDGSPPGQIKAGTTPPLVTGALVKASLVRPLGVTAPVPSGAPAAPLNVPSVTSPRASVPISTTGTPSAGISKNSVPTATPGLKSGTLPGGPVGTPLRGGSERQALRATGPGTPQQGSSPAPASGGTPGQASGPQFPTGTQVGFRITSISLPSSAASNIISPPSSAGLSALGAGRIITGVITGTTASGHPVIQTEAGVFSLNAQSNAPRGSVITLQVTTAPRPALATSAHPGTDTSRIFTDRRWPPLEEALQVVREASPASSQHLINSVLPRPDVQLTSGLVFFMSALRGGDMRHWFGESNMRILEKTRPNLASRLANDFNALGKVADEAINSDWRIALIPINTGAGIEQIRMLVRHHDNDDDENNSGDQGTRFILDVDLSRLGRIQLDGLVREKGQMLDLIIRSADTLNDENRNEIRRIFSEAAELTGIRGSVGFQASPPDFIEVPNPLAEDTVGLIV